MNDKFKIDIIGRGNVGWHLVRAFQGKADTATVNPRTLEGMRDDADIYLLSVSDAAIAEMADRVASAMPAHAILAHTSGTTPLSILDGIATHTGVFYPMQTFSKGIPLDYSSIPFFIEGSDRDTEDILSDCARKISYNFTVANSETRMKLHIASVFCCNFTNHLWDLTAQYLKANALEFQTMIPLIKETLGKLGRVSPHDGQTGPAARADIPTIERHIRMLRDQPNMQEIYKLLTASIMNGMKQANN